MDIKRIKLTILDASFITIWNFNTLDYTCNKLGFEGFFQNFKVNGFSVGKIQLLKW